ncbi:uncharacterized protein LOC119857665 [Dermochelys coriacea]|uniref:uncharacterized protein LOC119857665 n=1 Tax=Dermochelys coriacea TaxID=27794 RepID=UPI001CA9B7CA|nr:uncharacterized protein LOC119857665 [Dermochelys coriacea]
MGGGQSKNSPAPLKGTPAYYMYVHYGPGTCRYLENWNCYMRDNPSKQFPLEGTFDLDKLTYLRGTLTSPKASDTQWEQFVYWWKEATKRLHESRVRSLKDSQEKLKTEVQDLKIKCEASGCLPAQTTLLTPLASLYPQLVKAESEEGKERVNLKIQLGLEIKRELLCVQGQESIQSALLCMPSTKKTPAGCEKYRQRQTKATRVSGLRLQFAKVGCTVRPNSLPLRPWSWCGLGTLKKPQAARLDWNTEQRSLKGMPQETLGEKTKPNPKSRSKLEIFFAAYLWTNCAQDNLPSTSLSLLPLGLASRAACLTA